MSIRFKDVGQYQIKVYYNNKQVTDLDNLKIATFWQLFKGLFNKKKDILTIMVLMGKKVIAEIEIDL